MVFVKGVRDSGKLKLEIIKDVNILILYVNILFFLNLCILKFIEILYIYISLRNL